MVTVMILIPPSAQMLLRFVMMASTKIAMARTSPVKMRIRTAIHIPLQKGTAMITMELEIPWLWKRVMMASTRIAMGKTYRVMTSMMTAMVSPMYWKPHWVAIRLGWIQTSTASSMAMG